jgi:hypothetical protein
MCTVKVLMFVNPHGVVCVMLGCHVKILQRWEKKKKNLEVCRVSYTVAEFESRVSCGCMCKVSQLTLKGLDPFPLTSFRAQCPLRAAGDLSSR